LKNLIGAAEDTYFSFGVFFFVYLFPLFREIRLLLEINKWNSEITGH
jgi:hypothetical protein